MGDRVLGGLTPGIPKTQEVPKLVKFAALRCVKAIEQAEALFGIQLQLGGVFGVSVWVFNCKCYRASTSGAARNTMWGP